MSILGTQSKQLVKKGTVPLAGGMQLLKIGNSGAFSFNRQTKASVNVANPETAPDLQEAPLQAASDSVGDTLDRLGRTKKTAGNWVQAKGRGAAKDLLGA